jgi:hypothetical protein
MVLANNAKSHANTLRVRRALYDHGENVQIEIIWVIFASYFLLSLIVTFLIIKRDDFEPGQKVGQCILVWLIPFIAAIGIWIFLKSEDRDSGRKESFAKSSGGDNSVTNTFTAGGSD